ncbi:MAG TPA: hypothetical protein VLA19_22230 [Herpetosiphonaceae bacterium]|nr:hypothetical protein [Herpetosiphonaceae bacterium]
MARRHAQLALAAATERYIGLESLDVVEELITVCESTIDARALLIVQRRFREESARAAVLEQRGYTRMAEKSAQLVASLQTLMTALEGGAYGS